MDEAIFQSHFPNFPTGKDEIQKLAVMLQTKKVYTRDEITKLRADHPEGADFIKIVALHEKMLPKDLAEIEASILNAPFIDLEATQIATDVIKIFKIDAIVEHKVIPIKLSGQELLVGMVSPTDESALKLLGQTTSLVLRPAKVLLHHLETKIKQLTDKKPAAAKKSSGPRKRLGDVLVESKYVTPEQLKEALDGAKKEKMRIGTYLVKKSILTNKQLSVALSRQFEIPFVDLEESLVDPVLSALIPKKMCYEKILCVVKKEDNKLIVAFTDPTDIITIDHIEMMTGLRVSPVVSSELSIMSSLDKMFGETSAGITDQLNEAGANDAAGNAPEEDMGDLSENAAPIIKLVNLFFTQAASQGVSDIHIECFETELRIRFRKDGIMKLFMKSNKAAHPAVVSRIKVMASLDIAETRVPQDGRIKLNIMNRRIDVRVSTVPCVWGEKICMRLCDQGNLKVNLTDLGFEPWVLETFMKGVKAANGIVLVTGPTGSGKTTTLYSALFLLNNPGINIMTAEDPVEYNLMGVNQVQCHPDIGLDFGAALRAFLRQDPNVIMIGEIRDLETASIAIKAAMTGHLVISTLHTNDAPATVARLLNMGVEPFAVTSSVRVVEAQRLVRKICKSCYSEFSPPPDLVKSLGIDERMLDRLRLSNEMSVDKLVFAKGTGCPDCDNSGYKGRQGIYEVLVMTEGFRVLVEAGATPEEMRRQAMRDGMLSLRESALYKLLHKQTTSDEIVRSTMEGGNQDEKELADGGDAGSAAATSVGVSSGGVLLPGTAVSVPAIDGIAKEMQAFRSAIERFSISQAPIVQIENEALRQNLTDPLSQIQNQVRAGMSGGDVSKILPSIHAQGQKMDFNLRNLVTHFSQPAMKLAQVKVNELTEKLLLGAMKQHVILARLLAGDGNIGSNLKITKSLQQNLPNVLVDIDGFNTIAMNLVVNSLMGMPKGGELKVVTRLKPNTANRVEIALLDNGVGIPAEKQASLFTPFVPIGRKTLGLGLSVVKKLMTNMGGQISLKSTPGSQTLVVLELACAG
jgi:type IV pilus assembly protein PilB